MTTNPGWDPAQYLRFAGERLRPALDLIGRIPAGAPARVVDLGCGTGAAAPALRARFPAAALVGVDGSAAMLARARAAGCGTEQADIAEWAPAVAPDVIFSNAALHWVPDHARLFPRLLAALAPGGWLAVQMPAMDAAPLRTAQLDAAATGPWAARLRGVGSAPPILDPGAYWDLLSPHAARVELWVTEYVHVLRGQDPVVEWAMGSSLRPLLEPLADRPDWQAGLVAAYAAAMRAAYPPRADGVVLLGFRRLFLLAGG